MGRTHERYLGAPLAGGLGDLLVVGGNDDAIDQTCRQSRLDGMGDQRLAAERRHVLAREPLRSAACENEADGLAHRLTVLPSREARRAASIT